MYPDTTPLEIYFTTQLKPKKNVGNINETELVNLSLNAD